MTQEQLIAGTTSILEQVSGALPVANVTDARELLEHNEWGEALSLICTQLYEYDVRIDQALYERIVDLGRSMQLAPGEWEILQANINGVRPL